MITRMLVDAPANTSTFTYETLAYLDAYDAVLDCDYAFVAYKETEENGTWRVRIRSSQTAGGVFEPDAMRLQSRSAGAHGKPYFVWGYSFEPSEVDPRQIEFRVHVQDGAPTAIEILARLRKADGTADAPKSVTFAWPGATP